MKFTTSLAVAAIVVAFAYADSPSETQQNSTDGTPTSYCPNIVCPDVYDPVTDENGVTYPNKCSMEADKCKGPRENVLDEYERVYGKKFGAPRDENEDESKDDKCNNIICPAVEELPVCGSDGVWYSNPCEFSAAACKKNITEDATGTACN